MPIIDPNDFDFWKFTNDVFTVQSVTTTLGPRYTFGEFLDRAAHLSDDYKFTSYKVFSKGQLDLMLGELRNAFLNPSAAPKTPPIPFLTAGCEARRQFIPPGLLADDDGAMKAEETGDTTNRSKEMLIFASAGASSWYAYPARDRAWYLLLDGAATLYEPIADPHPIDPRKGLGELAKRYNDSTDKEAFQFEGQVREHPLTLGAAVQVPMGYAHKLVATENCLIACNLDMQVWDKKLAKQIPADAKSGPNPFGGKALGAE